ncbi:hypothetical protein [Salinicola tamaricis]|uniref:hypothetical protein n=1 Tax=Salinicola tamaricis TaxID=1771309 RepID=UPI001F5C528F|nr:hypothetical protein [Salinicola tamaricis]
MMVTMKPPGSLPGMISLAMAPAIRPKMIHVMMPMSASWLGGRVRHGARMRNGVYD